LENSRRLSVFVLQHTAQSSGMNPVKWSLCCVPKVCFKLLTTCNSVVETIRLILMLTFYARQQNASRVFAIVWASVCLSVTLVSCIKTVHARITKSSLWAAPRSLVYRDKISCHWVKGSPRTRASKRGTPLKRRHFAVIGSNNVKTVANGYIHAAYHNKHW